MLPSINLYMKVCKKETSYQLLFRLIFILANKFDQNTTYITDTETDKYSDVLWYIHYVDFSVEMFRILLLCEVEPCWASRGFVLYNCCSVVESEGCLGREWLTDCVFGLYFYKQINIIYYQYYNLFTDIRRNKQ